LSYGHLREEEADTFLLADDIFVVEMGMMEMMEA
jgi:hypothetical protein